MKLQLTVILRLHDKELAMDIYFLIVKQKLTAKDLAYFLPMELASRIPHRVKLSFLTSIHDKTLKLKQEKHREKKYKNRFEDVQTNYSNLHIKSLQSKS